MAERFRYKRKTLLELDEQTLSQIAALAQLQCTQPEAAAVMGCSRATFENFMRAHPEAREAWEDGRKQGRASLRRLLWKQAQTDEAQARFLAKDKRWLNMEDKSVEMNVNVTQTLTVDERKNRVLELQARVINEQPLSLTADKKSDR